MDEPLVNSIDVFEIVNDFLPRINKLNYDIFFNGHEHLNAYASLYRNEVLP
jgi:hypothetical protein